MSYDRDIMLIQSKLTEINSQLRLLSENFTKLYTLYMDERLPRHCACKICEIDNFK